MFNIKRIEKLERRLVELEIHKTDYIKCEKCKCLGEENDFFRVTFVEEYKSILCSYNDDVSYKFYCQRDKPNYDLVDLQEKEPRYYKTVAEHREEVKVTK